MEFLFLRDIKPREYQEKIFLICKEKNCLVVLPTGLGKTLIALLLAVERMKKFPGEKILFLAPTRPLAEQHMNYFKKHLPELFGDMQLFTGAVSAAERKEIWSAADIIFSTPQCIANDLKNRFYTLENVCLLVEDEAHRCLKNYDYNYVAKQYKIQAINQRILGLTASPGSESSKIREICRNLSIESVEVRTRESEDVKEYLQNLDFERINVDFPAEFEEIKIALKKIFNGYVEELRSRNVLFAPPSKTELIKLQKKISGTIARNPGGGYGYFHASSACAQAIKIQHALELIETQTLKSFCKYLENLMEQARKNKSKGVVKLVSSYEFNFVCAQSKMLMLKNIEHPKIKKMVEIIKKEFSGNEKSKVLIFSQFRDTASIISSKVNEIPGIKSKIFIGQAKKINEDNKTIGLNQKEQKKIIEEFSEGEINILCATSIGEEGLDIPEVNTVIFYEPVASAIRSIQRAGRTARMMKGKLIILVTKNTRDESFYYASRAKEKKMHSAISSIKEDLSKDEKKLKQNSIGHYF